MEKNSVNENVSEYYGKLLGGSGDIQSNACVLGRFKLPKHIRDATALIHKNVSSRYFGCGLIAPDALEGMTILDLGCGAGQDVFILSKLVGENGHVTGIDITKELLDIGRDFVDYHMTKFNYVIPNVDFVHGNIESMKESGIKGEIYQIIVSNCVVCLTSDKRSVFTEAYHALNNGGELFFSDIYAERDLPKEVRNPSDLELWGEGFGGALWWEDMLKIAEEIGFRKPRLVSASLMKCNNQRIKDIIGHTRYASVTYRMFKISQSANCTPGTATYTGGIHGSQEEYKFDYMNIFKKGIPKDVGADVLSILSGTRFKSYFDIQTKTDVQVSNAKTEQMDPFKLISDGFRGV